METLGEACRTGLIPYPRYVSSSRSAVDPPPSRSGEGEPEAGQSGQDLDAAMHAVRRDRAKAEKAMQEASAQAWERASATWARPIADPAWPEMERGPPWR